MATLFSRPLWNRYADWPSLRGFRSGDTAHIV